jgi:hypothetical protein
MNIRCILSIIQLIIIPILFYIGLNIILYKNTSKYIIILIIICSIYFIIYNIIMVIIMLNNIYNNNIHTFLGVFYISFAIILLPLNIFIIYKNL